MSYELRDKIRIHSNCIPLGMLRSVEIKATFTFLHPIRDASLRGADLSDLIFLPSDTSLSGCYYEI